MSDGVFYIPDHFEGHKLYSFPDVPRSSIEFCSGNGQWILQRAEADPSQHWIAVEWQFDRVGKIWSKAKRLGLTNLLIVCGDARLLVKHYLKRGSIAEAFVNFPDPWPKKRHAKHRLIQTPFLRDLGMAMEPGAPLTLVTDDPPYRDQMVEEVMATQLFEPQLEAPFWATDWTEYGASYFDTLWRGEGRQIHYLPFRARVI